MRDIKFRGKGKRTGIWVYGFLVDETHIEDLLSKVFIDKKTIGQYTGLKDKNGVEIYEGDIIEYSYDGFTGNFYTKTGKGIIPFDNGAFWIKPFEIEDIKVDMENEEWFLLYAVNEDTLEVIGNIYDNPELLKESD